VSLSVVVTLHGIIIPPEPHCRNRKMSYPSQTRTHQNQLKPTISPTVENPPPAWDNPAAAVLGVAEDG
jgi:hypothetical protein